MGFAATELCRHIEHGAGLGDSTRKSAHYFRREAGEILGQECTVEEPLRILVVLRSGSRANLIQMHGEFGSIDRFAFPQVFSRFRNVVPRLQLHFLHSPMGFVHREIAETFTELFVRSATTGSAKESSSNTGTGDASRRLIPTTDGKRAGG